jgi:hypothetical protein
VPEVPTIPEECATRYEWRVRVPDGRVYVLGAINALGPFLGSDPHLQPAVEEAILRQAPGAVIERREILTMYGPWVTDQQDETAPPTSKEPT